MTTAPATTTAHQRRRPVGREEVMGVALAAAAELFAERGPAATSIRDIAAKAEVNHGLIHRHFGSKEALISAVLDQLSEQTAILVGHASPPAEIASAAERHWRVLARAILDGYPVGQLQHHFPVVTKLVDEARHHNRDEASARIAAGHAVAFELGWRLFESFIRSAAQLEDLTADELRRSANRLRDSIVSTPLAS
jgi:TetR/AcrR family transcriptional regulator, repressor for neighboring sulfatase